MTHPCLQCSRNKTHSPVGALRFYEPQCARQRARLNHKRAAKMGANALRQPKGACDAAGIGEEITKERILYGSEHVDKSKSGDMF